MTDILARPDIEMLIRKFYDKVQADRLLAPHFAHVDFPAHLPTMFKFWSSMILGEQSYQGNPFQKHIPLKIGTEHFQQWLKLFFETVDENFQGDRAEEIKKRAESIAGVFQYKLGLMGK